MKLQTIGQVSLRPFDFAVALNNASSVLSEVLPVALHLIPKPCVNYAPGIALVSESGLV